MITSVNPASEKLLAEFEPWSVAQVDEAVDRVGSAQRAWRAMSVADRSRHRLPTGGGSPI